VAGDFHHREVAHDFCTPMGGVEHWTCCDEKNNIVDNKEDVCQQVAIGSLLPTDLSCNCFVPTAVVSPSFVLFE